MKQSQYELTMRVAELEMQRKYLWELLDDISTAGDMFKPKIDGYFKYVNNKSDARRHVLCSLDGYNLVETKSIKNDGEDYTAVYSSLVDK
jgi:hypothetical protein